MRNTRSKQANTLGPSAVHKSWTWIARSRRLTSEFSGPDTPLGWVMCRVAGGVVESLRSIGRGVTADECLFVFTGQTSGSFGIARTERL